MLTQVDRKTRYLMAMKVPNASSEAVRDTMIFMFSRLPENKVRSITPDRGREFAKHTEVSAAVYDIPFYFADPYSPWQRGTNKNTNSLLRQYVSKYTSRLTVYLTVSWMLLLPRLTSDLANALAGTLPLSSSLRPRCI